VHHQNDFDWEIGDGKVHLRRLLHPLTGSARCEASQPDAGAFPPLVFRRWMLVTGDSTLLPLWLMILTSSQGMESGSGEALATALPVTRLPSFASHEAPRNACRKGAKGPAVQGGDEEHLMPDHVHMCVAIPPKYPVASAIGFLKGKGAIAIARLCGKERNLTGEQFWARGYWGLVANSTPSSSALAWADSHSRASWQSYASGVCLCLSGTSR
jgi:Transposase IS200 like